MSNLKEKLTDKAQEEIFNEGVNFYTKWRQSVKNGVLPIGSSEVGKTTLLSRLDVQGIDLFMDFNRTTKSKVDTLKLRAEFIKASNGVEHIRKIDVPGDLPEEWVTAYFDNSPRVLVIMVDDRNSHEHIKRLRVFVENYKKGSSFWQKTKTVVTFNWNNLTRILFVVNKSDKIEKVRLDNIQTEYAGVLSEMHSLFNVNIQIFKVSLNDTDENLKPFFMAVLDSFSRK